MIIQVLPYPPAVGAVVTFVGSAQAGYNGNGGTFNFAALRDPSDREPTLQEGDTVLCYIARSAAASLCIPSGYSELGSAGGSAWSYKAMGATPDTSLAVPSEGTSVGSAVVLVFVYRGLSANVLDAAAVTSSASFPTPPNGGAVTPYTANALILVGGYITDGGESVGALTKPANLSSAVNRFVARRESYSGTLIETSAAAGVYENWESGAFDPDPFGGGGTFNNSYAITLALRADGAALTKTPTISGEAYVDAVLTVDVISATYQWKRDGSPISGATSSTYTLVDDDEGANIACSVTIGGATLTSNAIGPVVRLLSSIEAMFAGGETGDLWRFDAANTDATTAGDAISTATGLVNGLALAQPTSGNRPTLQSSGGHECARFDGSNDFLRYAFGSTVAQPGTILIALRNNSTATHVIVTGSSSSSRWQISNDSSDNIIAFAASTLDSAFNSPIGDAVLNVEFNGASTKFRKNGVQTASGNAGTQGTNQLTVGALWDGTFGGAQDIYAVMFISRVLTPTERADAENYMARISPATI